MKIYDNDDYQINITSQTNTNSTKDVQSFLQKIKKNAQSEAKS